MKVQLSKLLLKLSFDKTHSTVKLVHPEICGTINPSTHSDRNHFFTLVD